MHNLKPLTPLGAEDPRRDTIGQMVIAEQTDQALASLSVRTGQGQQTREAVRQSTGLDLPEVGQVADVAPMAALWVGPEQWMIAAPYDTHENLAHHLKSIVGSAATVVEQTDAWCCFDLSGPALCDLLERLTNAPVRTMQDGAVTRTTMEHVGVYLWRITSDRAVVLGPRSSAGSLHHALLAAARSIE